jgi:hypothetical protein
MALSRAASRPWIVAAIAEKNVECRPLFVMPTDMGKL